MEPLFLGQEVLTHTIDRQLRLYRNIIILILTPLGSNLMKKLKKFCYTVMKERKSTLDLMMEGEFIILKNHLKE